MNTFNIREVQKKIGTVCADSKSASITYRIRAAIPLKSHETLHRVEIYRGGIGIVCTSEVETKFIKETIWKDIDSKLVYDVLRINGDPVKLLMNVLNKCPKGENEIEIKCVLELWEGAEKHYTKFYNDICNIFETSGMKYQKDMSPYFMDNYAEFSIVVIV